MRTGVHETASKREPLSAPALAIVKRMMAKHEGEFLFPGTNFGRRMHTDAMLDLLQRLAPGMTTHGTARASFSSWCADRGEPRELAEMALGHAVGDATERAYMRADMLERRRLLAERWAAHCCRSIDRANVVTLRP